MEVINEQSTIDRRSAKVTCSKKEAVAAVDATMAAIKKALKKVMLLHLWLWNIYVKKKEAVQGRNLKQAGIK